MNAVIHSSAFDEQCLLQISTITGVLHNAATPPRLPLLHPDVLVFCVSFVLGANDGSKSQCYSL